MDDRRTEPNPARRKWMLIALCLSLTANVMLVLRLARPAVSPNRAEQPGTLAVAGQPVAGDSGGAGARVEQAGPAPAPLPFVWGEIEHDDYRQYIANLRAVGCPEETIRDLIAADLSQHYVARAATIWRRAPIEYWRKSAGEGPTPAQQQELRDLADEQGAVLTDLLGVPMNTQQLMDLLYLQVHSAEQQLLFLPEGSRAAAVRALDEAGYDRKLMDLHTRSSYSQGAEEKLFAEQLEILSGVLSPAELTEFRLRHAPKAQQLRMELQYFDCTPAEFEQLLDAREQNKKVATGNLLDRGLATEQFRDLFGDERSEEFERVTSMYYQNARRAVDQAELPVDYADSAWQICRDTQAAADQLAQDRTLSAEERSRRLGQMRAEADRQLNVLLGEKVAQPLRRDLGVVFQVAEMKAKQ